MRSEPTPADGRAYVVMSPHQDRPRDHYVIIGYASTARLARQLALRETEMTGNEAFAFRRCGSARPFFKGTADWRDE